MDIFRETQKHFKFDKTVNHNYNEINVFAYYYLKYVNFHIWNSVYIFTKFCNSNFLKKNFTVYFNGSLGRSSSEFTH